VSLLHNIAFNNFIINNFNAQWILNNIIHSNFFEKFKQHYKKIDKELGDTGTRKITIELDNAFNNDWDKNIHIVEFSTEDTSETGQVVTNYWKAVIGYKFNRQKIRVDDIIQNPLGIEIIDYEIIKRNIMK
jgi:type IV secretory pathway component VirB8